MTRDTDIFVRVETDHDPDETWHGWWLTERTDRRDAIGRRGSRTVPFLLVWCANPACNAQALARRSDLERLVIEALPVIPASESDFLDACDTMRQDWPGHVADALAISKRGDEGGMSDV